MMGPNETDACVNSYETALCSLPQVNREVYLCRVIHSVQRPLNREHSEHVHLIGR
jgi:hypothetical protein